LVKQVDFMNKKAIKSYLYAVVGIIIMVVLDQITKIIAIDKLKGKKSVNVIPNVLSFTYLENEGAAWGILKNHQLIFIIISIVLTAAIAYYYNKLPYTKRFRPFRITLSVLCAGAVGNTIDRIFHKYVVDFFQTDFIEFPVFNVADIYVTCSIAALLILILFVYSEQEIFLEGEDNEKS